MGTAIAETKSAPTRQAIEDGAGEIEMVMTLTLSVRGIVNMSSVVTMRSKVTTDDSPSADLSADQTMKSNESNLAVPDLTTKFLTANWSPRLNYRRSPWLIEYRDSKGRVQGGWKGWQVKYFSEVNPQ